VEHVEVRGRLDRGAVYVMRGTGFTIKKVGRPTAPPWGRLSLNTPPPPYAKRPLQRERSREKDLSKARGRRISRNLSARKRNRSPRGEKERNHSNIDRDPRIKCRKSLETEEDNREI